MIACKSKQNGLSGLRPVGRRRGAMAVLIAFFLPVFLIMAGFAINVAYMQLARAELRVATDAAARAGARTLSLTQSTAEALNAARDAATRNLVAGQPLQLDNNHIQFGINSRADNSSPWLFTAQWGQRGGQRGLRHRLQNPGFPFRPCRCFSPIPWASRTTSLFAPRWPCRSIAISCWSLIVRDPSARPGCRRAGPNGSALRCRGWVSRVFATRPYPTSTSR